MISGFSSFVMKMAGIPKLVEDLKNRTWSHVSDCNGQLSTTALEPWGLSFPMFAMIIEISRASGKNNQGGDLSLKTEISPLQMQHSTSAS